MSLLSILLVGQGVFAQNNALVFDGIDDRVDIGGLTLFDGSTNQPFTIETWINTTQADADAVIWSIGVGTGMSLQLRQNSLNQLELIDVDFPGTGAILTTAEDSFNDGRWHHTAVIYNGIDIQIYLDGLLVGETTRTFTLENIMRIGESSLPSGSNWNGQIDEIRVWNRSLESGELLSNLFFELFGFENGLTHYYNFNAISGTTLPDVLFLGAADGTLFGFDDPALTMTSGATEQQTITPAGSGNWNDGATWVGGMVPLPIDNVTIGGNPLAVVNITIANPAIVFGLTINAFSNVNQNATLQLLGDFSATIDGTYASSSPSNFLEFIGNAQNISGAESNPLPSVIIDGTGIKAVTASIVVNGGLVIRENATLNGLNNLIRISNTGNWLNTGTFVPSGSTVEFNGTSHFVQNGNFNNLTLSSTGTLNFQNDAVITGSFTVNGNGIVDMGSNTITAGTAWDFGSVDTIMFNPGARIVVNQNMSQFSPGVGFGPPFNTTYPTIEVTQDGNLEFFDPLFIDSGDSLFVNGGSVRANGELILGEFSQLLLENGTVTMESASVLLENNALIRNNGGRIVITEIEGASFFGGLETGDEYTFVQDAGSLFLERANFRDLGGNGIEINGGAIESFFDVSFSDSDNATAYLTVNSPAFDNMSINDVSFAAGPTNNVNKTDASGMGTLVISNASGSFAGPDFQALGTNAGNITWPGLTFSSDYALDFDGSNDFVQVTSGGPAFGGPITIEAWINPDLTSGSRTIYSWETGSGDFNALRINGGVLELAFISGNTLFSTDVQSIPANVWTHVAFTLDASNNYNFYVNGQPTGSGMYFGSGGASVATYIGSLNGATDYFNGDIDDIRIWNVVRTPTEIADNRFNQFEAPFPSNLVTFYNFNEGQGMVLNELVGGVFNGDLMNFNFSLNSSNWFPAIGKPTQVQHALNFNGVGNNVTVSGFFIPTNYTIEAWIRPTNLVGTRVVTGWGDLANTENVSLSLVEGVPTFTQNTMGGNTILAATHPLRSNEWHHLAVVKNGSIATLYVNGIEMDASTAASDLVTFNALRIAAIASMGNPMDPFSGSIDEVRVWNGAVGIDDLRAFAITEDLSSHPNIANIEAHYTFNEGIVPGGDNTGLTNLTNVDGTAPNGTLSTFDALTGATSNWVLSDAFEAVNVEVVANGNFISRVSSNIPSADENTAFGVVFEGQSSTNQLLVINGGFNPVSITRLVPSGDFALASSDLLITPFDTVFLDVTFAPAAFGEQGEDISFDYQGDLGDSEAFSFTLSGTGYPSEARAGRALSFGQTSFLTLSNADHFRLNGDSLFTIEAWVNLGSTGTFPIFSNVDTGTGGQGYEFAVTDGRVSLRLVSDNSFGAFISATSNTTIGNGIWSHVAATYDGSSLETGINIYINGVLQPVTTNGMGFNTNINILNAPPQLGTNSSFGGEMDEFRLWDGVRTNEQILASTFRLVDPNSPGLRSSYRFDEGIGMTVFDLTGNSTGSLTGDPEPFFIASGAVLVDDSEFDNLFDIRALWQGDVEPDQSANFSINSSGFLNTVQNNIVFGHDNQLAGDEEYTTDRITTVSAVVGEKLVRNWYISPNNEVSQFGDFNLIFDNLVVDSTFTYYLLRSPDNVSEFEIVPYLGYITTNDTIGFQLSAGDFGGSGFFSLGRSAPLSFSGNALALDGQNDGTEAAGVAHNEEFTYEAWVNVGTNVPAQSSLIRLGGEGPSIDISVTPAGEILAAANEFFGEGQGPSSDEELTTSGAGIADGQWHHIAVTRDFTNGLMIYIDGNLNATSGMPMLSAVSFSEFLSFGNSSGTPLIIDEFRLWGVARSAEEIANNFQRVVAGQGDLLVYYRFDQIAGTNIPDLSGNAAAATLFDFDFNGTNSDWVTSDAFNFLSALPILPGAGNAYQLDGSPTQSAVTNNPNSELTGRSFSVEYWARRNDNSTIDFAFGQGTGTSTANEELQIGFRAGNTVTFGFFADDLDFAWTDANNEWNHFAFTYDAATNDRKIYINGIQVAQDIAAEDYLGSGEFFVGQAQFGENFDGDLDEMRVWNVVLDENLIRRNLAQKLPTNNLPLDSLIVYYRFDDAPGGEITDFTGVYPLTINGGTLVPSDAPFGDESTFTYAGSVLSGAAIDQAVQLTNIATPADGVHLYRVITQDAISVDFDVFSNIFSDNIFGVFAPNSNTFDFRGSLADVPDDENLRLVRRNDQADINWVGASTVFGTDLVEDSIRAFNQLQGEFSVGELQYPRGIAADSAATALSFNGSNQVNLATVPTDVYSAFTIEHWVRPTSVTNEIQYFLQQDPLGNPQPQIVLTGVLNGHLYMFIRATNSGVNGFLEGNQLINDNEWHHVAYVRDGTNVSFYVDGVLDVSTNAFGLAGDINFPANAEARFDGDAPLDEFKFWDTALTADEIRNHIFTNDLSTHPQLANLKSYFRFDDGTGSDRLVDLVGYHNGDLIGFDLAADWITSGAFASPADTVVSLADSGPGSLRDIIEKANANPGSDTVRFNLPGNGPWTINLASEILVTDSLVIEGDSQPGFDFANSLIVEIDGGGTTAFGLHYQTDYFEQYGLKINNFSSNGIRLNLSAALDGYQIGAPSRGNVFVNNQIAIQIIGSVNGLIRNNLIGINPDGTAGPNDNGIRNSNGAFNIIGGSAADANIIANNSVGVFIEGASAVGNLVRQNEIFCNTSLGINLFNGSHNDIAAPIITSITTTEVSGTALNGQEIDVYLADDACTSDQGATYLGTVVAAADGTWSLGSLTLTEGSFFTATASTTADGTSEFSAAVRLDIDPVVTVDDVVTNVASPEIVGTIDDIDATVNITVDGNAFPATNNLDGTWTLAAGDITPDLLEGVFTIDVLATDSLGNEGMVIGNLTVDLTAPAAPTVDVLFSNSQTPVVTGTFEQGTELEITVASNSFLLSSNPELTDDGSGIWTLDLAGSPNLAEGPVDVLATSTDLAGNVTNDLSTDELTIDLTLPVVTVNAVATTQSSPELNGTIIDIDLATTVQVEVAGSVFTATNNGDGTWTLAAGAITPPLAEGTFDVIVTATDRAGNVGNDGTLNELVVDATLPTNPTVDVLVTNNQTPILTGTFEDGTDLEVTVNGQAYVLGTSPQLTASVGTWSLDLMGEAAIPEGVFDVVATSTDVASNTSSDLTLNELTIDLTDPVPEINLLVTNLTSPELSGMIDDLSASVEVEVAGNTFSAVNNGDGTWTLAQGMITPALVEGIFEVQVTATDAAGNIGVDVTNNELTIDLTPPTVTIDALITNEVSPALGGSVNDLMAIVDVEIAGNTFSAVNNGDGTWTLAQGVITPTLSEGVFDVLVSATDIAGNQANDLTMQELTVDITAPANPTVNPLLINNPNPPINGTFEEGTSLQVTVNGQMYTLGSSPQLTEVASGTWLLDLTGETPLTEGTFDVVAISTDAATNSSTDLTVDELEIDLTSPPIPTVNALTTNDQRPTVTGTFPEGVELEVMIGLDSYLLTVDPELTDDGAGNWSLNLSATADLPEDIYDVIAISSDAAGNMSTDVTSGELIIDITAPVVTVDALLTTETSPALTGTVDDVNATISIEVDGNVYMGNNVGDGTWTLGQGIITPPLLPAIYDVAVDATDMAGNTGMDLSVDELIVTSAPTALAATMITPQQFIANWQLLPGISDYELDVAFDDQFTTFVPGFENVPVATNSATVTGLDYSTTYFYRVRGVIAPGSTTDFSNVITVQTTIASGTVADEQALRRIFNEMDGANWSRQSGWSDITARIENFDGVTVVDGRVTAIDLSSNNLSGDLPDFTGEELDQLQTLLLNGNGISSLSDLTTLTLLTNVQVQNNNLDFSTLEVNAGISGIVFSPQALLLEGVALLENEGDDVTLDRTVGGTSNVYRWTRNGTELSGETNGTLSLTALSFDDDGLYEATVTNDMVPGLTLTTAPIMLTVSSLERDSISLRAIYDNMGGANWEGRDNWNPANDMPLSSWEGLTFGGNRITGVDLNDVNASGRLPEDVLNMLSLADLDIANNEVDSIPSLEPLMSLTSFDVSGNLLQFDDLEANLNVAGFVFGGQRLGDASSEVEVQAGEEFTVSVMVAGSNNTYQWSLEGVDIPGANSPEFLISPISRATNGVYICTIGSNVPGLESLEIVSSGNGVFGIADVSGIARIAGQEGQFLSDGLVRLLAVREDAYDTLRPEQPFALSEGGAYLYENVRLDDYIVLVDPTDRDDFLPTYFEQVIQWDAADTLRLDSDTTGIDVFVEPFPTIGDVGAGGLVGEVFTDFPEEDGRLEVRRRVRRVGCALRRRRGQGRPEGRRPNGRVEMDDDGFELFSYQTTDDNGQFTFENLPIGTYRLFIEYPGIPLDPDSFTEFEVGENPNEDDFAVQVTVFEDGILIEELDVVGVDDQLQEVLRIYPNPVVEELNVDLGGLTDRVINVEILSLKGVTILSEEINSADLVGGRKQIDMSGLTKGVYLLRVTLPNQQGNVLRTGKIIVNGR